MKKIILIVVLLIAAATPAIPYFIGASVEQTIRKEIEQAAIQNELSGARVELVSYERGVFNANAVTRFTFQNPNDKKEEISFDVIHHINHTPHPLELVLATVDSNLQLNGRVQEVLSPLFKDQSPIQMTTRVYFDGHQEGTVFSPAVSGQLGDNEKGQLEWQGLTGTVWQSADQEHAKVQMDAPGIHFSKIKAKADAANMDSQPMPAQQGASETPKTVTLSELKYEADLTKTPSGLWASKGSVAARLIEFAFVDKDGSDVKVTIDNTDFHGEQSETNGLLQVSGSFKAGQINANGMVLKDAVYDLAIENIDSKAMKALQGDMKQITEAESKRADPFEVLLPHLPALVNAQPVLKINEVSVNSPMGHFAMSMKSQLKGQWNDMVAQNPLLLTQMIVADLQAEVPRSVVTSALEEKVRDALIVQAENSGKEISDEDMNKMVKQAVEQRMASLIAQGYIKEKDAQLITNVSYNAGQLTINGQDATPLLGMLMN